MKFRNVKVPEGINVSRRRPLRDLLTLSVGAIAVFVVLTVALWYFGGALARLMPVRWENVLADVFIENQDELEDEGKPAIETALQNLADRLSVAMDLPEDMRIRVHYVDSDTLNAAASLGGQVFMYRGLLSRLPNENALAMVMAHEIAHAANRDAIANVSGLLLSQLFLAVAVGGTAPSLERVLSGPDFLLLRGFSRAVERRADEDALMAVVSLYGHVAEATRVFDVFLEEGGRDDNTMSEFLGTHPLGEVRIANIVAMARERRWRRSGSITPLAPVLAELAR